MKRYSLFILMLVLLFGLSCKKEFITNNNYPDKGSFEAVKPSATETTATEAEIKVTNDWKIIEQYSANNADVRMWKMKSTSTNKVVLIGKAPADLFFKDEYQPGYNKEFPGIYVLALLSGKNL